MRLIDAEPIENYEGWLDDTCLVIPKDLIYEAPTIEAEPIRYGHWEAIINAYGETEGFIHTECGHTSYSKDNYCPYCGTKMDEVE